MDLLSHNRQAWDSEVEKGNIWTKPVDRETIAAAREGHWQIVLTPTKPVPASWFPSPLAGMKVLCLASGGGQQGPILAAAGAEVTVFDNSPRQLAGDRLVAERENLAITLEQGDMRDLARFPDASFDLVINPVSTLFVDDVLPVWKEVYRVSRPGGTFLTGFINPIVFIYDYEAWNEGKLIPRYKIPYSDLRDLPPEQLQEIVDNVKDPVCFGHSLEDLIGGQLDAGFTLTGFYEDRSTGDDPLDQYLDTFIATRASKKK